VAIGLAATCGKGTPIERISGAIAWSGTAYVVAAGLILAAFGNYRRVSLTGTG